MGQLQIEMRIHLVLKFIEFFNMSNVEANFKHDVYLCLCKMQNFQLTSIGVCVSIELVMLWVASLPSCVIDMASVREGISSGDNMGETEAGVVTASLASVELRISDSFINEFTTVSLCAQQAMNEIIISQ